MNTPLLLMIAPAPAIRLSDSRLRLDAKFVEGAQLHARCWDGRIRFVLWEGSYIPFPREVDDVDLDFDVILLRRGEMLSARHLQDATLIAASADMHQVLGLPDMAKAAGAKLVYTIEYTLDTRLRIVWLEEQTSIGKKLRSSLWHLKQERSRRKALRKGDGIQFNGWPAQHAYQKLNDNCLLYLDNRMRSDLMASAEDMASRDARLLRGAPIRLAHSGRLEPLKGSRDLIPVARYLRDAGMGFTLDIWGTGSLAAEIAAEIREARLEDRVRLHDPLPFEDGLIPALRERADLFLSCHRQSDPSCSYLEAMGCGLPVVGYDNAMLSSLAEASGGAGVVRMGDIRALAKEITKWDSDRENLVLSSAKALAFAKAHDFKAEFEKRMRHFKSVAGLSGRS